MLSYTERDMLSFIAHELAAAYALNPINLFIYLFFAFSKRK
jgi:hypothetical protein